MKVGRCIKSVLMGALLPLSLVPANAFAFDVNFKGRVQTTYVLRDTNGFQYGVMDELEGVQWRNELKFDVEVLPSYPGGKPPVRLEKFYLSYRGAYDAIFDLSDRYDTVREKSPADFEYGRDDLKWENDLREAFVDFRGEGGKNVADLRLGRQVVQWGEADGFNLMNIVNPQDNRFLMFFDNPEDLANPLWMGKLELTRNQVGPFHSLGLQLLAIPDVRPNIFAPLDGTYDAPYAFFFKGLQGFGPIREDVPSSTLDNMEYGARLAASWADTTAFLYYFKGIQDAGVLDLSFSEGTLVFRHPETKTYGASFNTFLDSVNAVLRGEASYTDGQNFGDMSDLAVSGRGFSEHDYYQALLGIDKDLTNVKLGTETALGTSFQVYYNKIDGWDEAAAATGIPEDAWRLTALFYNDYMHGQIKPSIFAMYDPEGAWMTQAGIEYSPDGRWYYKLTEMSFWGNKDATSSFAPLIGTSELSLRAGYRW